jgi:hypothetical protein
VLFVERKDGTQ